MNVTAFTHHIEAIAAEITVGDLMRHIRARRMGPQLMSTMKDLNELVHEMCGHTELTFPRDE